MSSAEIAERTADQFQDTSHARWQQFEHETAFQCTVLLCPEEVGFSAHCLNLKGVISEGNTEQEALANIAEAFRETILYYRESGESIPFGLAEVDYPAGAKQRCVLVRV